MVDAAKVRIAVDVDSSGGLRGVAQLSKAFGGLDSSLNRSIGRINKSFSSLSTAQKTLGTVGIGIGLLGTALAGTIRPAIEFESAFAGVEKTVSGTPRQLQGIRDGIIEMSRVMPVAATELADIAANAGQLGVAAPDVLKFTETVAKLGATTDLSFDSAAQSLARFLNITGSGASAIDGVADVIVELGNNSATTESQIVDMATRMASAFTLAGATEDEILALASAFSSLGERAESGGSSLATIITVIADAARTGGADLEILARTAGLLPEEFAEITRSNPVEALLLFGEGLGRVADEGRAITPILDDLELSGIRIGRAMELLAGASDFVRGQILLASDALAQGGAAQTEYEKRVETTAAKLDIFKQRLSALAIAAGTPILGTLVDGLDLAGDAIERLFNLLAPLGAEIGRTFGNAGQLISGFFDVLSQGGGSGSLGAVETLVDSLSELLGLANDLGPAGLAIGALTFEILRVGPASVAAQKAIDAFGIATATANVSISGLASGAAGLLASINPVVLAIAAVGSIALITGKQLADMRSEAERTASVFAEDLDAALQQGSAVSFAAEISDLQSKMERLNETASNGPGFFDQLGTSLFHIPFTDTTTAADRAKIKLEELEKVFTETQADNFARNVSLIGDHLDLTEAEVLAAVDATGQLNNLLADGVQGLITAEAAVDAYTSGVIEATDGQREFAESITTGEATIESIAEHLGITADQIAYLSTQIDGVDFEDFFSDDINERVQAFLLTEQYLNNVIDEQAAILGTNRQELLAVQEAVDDAAASYNVLRSAVESALDSMKAINAQQEETAASLQRFEEAKAAIDGTEESFRAAAVAGQEFIANFAASGATIEEVRAKQAELANQLYDTQIAFGASDEEALKYIADLLLIPEEILVEILQNASDYYEESDRVKQDKEDLAEEVIVRADANVDSATGRMDFLRRQARAVADDDYTLDPAADTLSATERMDQLRRHSRDVADEEYELQGTAADAGATDTMNEIGSEGRRVADDDYTVDMQATDNATGTINSVEAAARRAAGTYRVNLVTYTSTVALGIVSRVPSYARSNRWGSIAGFDSGGIAGTLERPGRANIYSPATQYRMFAEPQTGGEAYIPIRGDRQRNHEIWTRVGSILGFMRYGAISAFQNGGIVPPRQSIASTPSNYVINLSAPVNVSVNASGDPAAIGESVARRVRREVDASMRQISREIKNARLVRS